MRFWDRARALRPSMHEKQKDPLIEKYMKDNRIRFADFEHTIMTEELRPLTREEREESLSRLEWELREADHLELLNAFWKGYTIKTNFPPKTATQIENQIR